MAYVRGEERFVAEEVVDRVRRGLLEGMGWNGAGLGPSQLPWGASVPLTFVEAPPDPLNAGAKIDVVAPNTVAISEGRLPPDEELELGTGRFVQTVYTFFIDVYGENRSIARCIALDVRALLTNRIAGYSDYLPLRDWRDNARPALAGHQLHFEDVEVDYPAVGNATKMHWAVVKATVIHEHTF
jgi:hypothetical protein